MGLHLAAVGLVTNSSTQASQAPRPCVMDGAFTYWKNVGRVLAPVLLESRAASCELCARPALNAESGAHSKSVWLSNIVIIATCSGGLPRSNGMIFPRRIALK